VKPPKAFSKEQQMSHDPVIIRGLDEAVASVPHLLGTTVRDSLVVLPATTANAPVARVDMPATEHQIAETIQSIAPAYRNRNVPVILLAYTDRRDLAEMTTRRLADALQPACPVTAALTVNGDRWVRLDRPEHGTVAEATRDRLTAEFLYRSQPVPYPSQEEHQQSFAAGPDVINPHTMEAATTAAAGRAGDPEQSLAEQTWIGDAVAQHASTRHPFSEADAARLLADVQHIGLRDHAWSTIERRHAADHAHMWKNLLTRAPEGAQAPAASLAAYAFWVAGDGMSARAALERIPPDQPYSMANLISTALAAGINPKNVPLPSELPAELRTQPSAPPSTGIQHQMKEPPGQPPGTSGPDLHR
jgi:hypothetical protein